MPNEKIINLKNLKIFKEEYDKKVFDFLHSRNLLNKEECTDDYYVSYLTGNLMPNDEFSVSDYIDISELENLVLWKSAGNIGSLQCAFYDRDKTFISGVALTTAIPTTSIPSGAYYIRVSLDKSYKHQYVLESGTQRSSSIYVPYLSFIVPKSQKVLDYYYLLNSDSYLRQYLVAVGDCANDKHWIRYHIPKGNHNLYGMLTNEEKENSSFVGIFVPDYVFVVGDSEPEDTVLYISLESRSQNLSTLNFAGTSGIENITVRGTNTRYAIHDDFATSTYTNYKDYYYRIVKNCIIEGITTYYDASYGSGSRSGAKWLFENVKFKQAFTWHSNVNFDIPNDITLINCKVDIPSGYRAVILKSLGSGVINRIHFIGCNIPYIACTEETSNLGSDFQIDGYGNNDILVGNYMDGTWLYPKFSDRVVTLRAYENITKGKPLWQNASSAVPFTSATQLYRLAGIALNNANAGDFVDVLFSGSIWNNGLTAITGNNPISIISGAIAISSSNIIGEVLTQYNKDFVTLEITPSNPDLSNYATIDQALNVINASDIVNNTLTQAQYDLITNGKPTIILGTFRNLTNPILFSGYATSSYYFGLIQGYYNGEYQFLIYYINLSTKLVEIDNSKIAFNLANNQVILNRLQSVNGKTIPAYPSSTGTWTLKCVNGALTWVAD